MSEKAYQRLDEFEVTWTSGYVDRFKASQVSYSGGYNPLTGTEGGVRFISFYGMIEDSWTLVLKAREEEIQSVRNLTQAGELL